MVQIIHVQDTKIPTFPVILWMTNRETVTVAVLFMQPAFVTTPVNAMGGMLFGK